MQAASSNIAACYAASRTIRMPPSAATEDLAAACDIGAMYIQHIALATAAALSGDAVLLTSLLHDCC